MRGNEDRNAVRAKAMHALKGKRYATGEGFAGRAANREPGFDL